MIEIHQWQLLLIHFGDYLDLFETEKNYKKENFSNGINLGREFSEPHMAIVLSPTPLCKGDTILVVPITNYTLNDEKHWDKIVLDNYNFLHKKSSIHLSAIRNISKKRIIKEIRPYISKSIQRDIKNKLCSFFK
jgi:mRNA-degrading endonuclease toxin of MazEF toxin-antitoxin module